jgi:hypothetical protein
MSICYDCATNKGLVPKDKIVSVWKGICPYCRYDTFLNDEIHDYKYSKQKAIRLEDILIYQCNNPEKQ